MIKEAYEEYRAGLQRRFSSDPKSFWAFIKKKRSNVSRTSITREGIQLSPMACAKEFATYFHSVYNENPPKLCVQDAIESAGACGMQQVIIDKFTFSDVVLALKHLKPKYSYGPDGIPPFLLRDCGKLLAGPLLHIYNPSLGAHFYTDEWKLTRVIPVPKGGVSPDVEGYRPIAVLSSCATVFESILHRYVYRQVGSQLSDAQHGFRPGRNTDSNMLCFMTYAVPAIDSGVQVDAAYFDFRKAFDTVDNDILLRKMAAIGFSVDLLEFFASYLRDRKQYVDYDGHLSDPFCTNSGVSQGSNLGPLEFLIMINDLPKALKDAVCLLFADDLKLLLRISSSSDCDRLQEDLDRVDQWSHENKLYFNSSKCCVITYGRGRKPVLHDYSLQAIDIGRVQSVRDLGIRMDTELNFRSHVLDISKKAFRNLGFILRQSSDFTNIHTIKALYNALVRTRLESGAMVWSPHEKKYIGMIEKMQNKFTRFLYLKLYGVYPFYPLMYPSLFVLGMVGYTKLEVRREIILIMYIFRLLRGMVHNPRVLMCVGLCVPDNYVGARRRPRLLAIPIARTNLLSEAPFTRALRVINSLCESDDIDIFSSSLAKFSDAATQYLCAM